MRPEELLETLGPPRYRRRELDLLPEVGAAQGLAWTATGGRVLTLEALHLPGSGKVQLTGKLGEVFQEACRASLTWIRSQPSWASTQTSTASTIFIFTCLRSGVSRTPAGITIAFALLSSLTGVPIRGDLAMTGSLS